MRKLFFFIALSAIIFSCDQRTSNTTDNASPGGADIHLYEYFNYGDTGVQMAGIKMIPVKTPAGEFKVWTKRFGNNPRIKVLLLHGGLLLHINTWKFLKAFFLKKDLNFMNTISWVLITATNQKTAVCGQQNDLWKKWSK